jgi:hypothetical protein
MLLLRMSEVRDEFDLNASANLIPPSAPIVLLLRLRYLRHEFDLSASANSVPPVASILLSV